MAENVAGQTVVHKLVEGSSPHFANGSITFDGTSITATDYVQVMCGFTPRYVCFHNDTDRIKVEWRDGMAADTCIKTAAAGTVTLETTNKGITVIDKGFRVSQNATLAVIAASKVCRWTAQA